MLHELYELGETVQQFPEKGNLNAQGIDGVKHVLLVNLEFKDGSYEYRGVTIEDYKSEHWNCYLYRKKAAAGPYYTPTYVLNKKIGEDEEEAREDVIGTLTKKFVAWFNPDNADKYWGRFSGDSTLKAIGNAVLSAVHTQHENISVNTAPVIGNLSEDLWRAYRQIVSQENVGKKKGSAKVLVSVLFRHDGMSYYLEDFNNGMFASLLNDVVGRAKGEDGRGSSRGIGTCVMCKRSNVPVNGLALSKAKYQFSVLDKYIMLPDMTFSNAWKAMPVCDDCYNILLTSNKYVTENLSFPRRSFEDKKEPQFPLNFWMIPSCPFGMTVDALRTFESILNDGTVEGLMVADDQLGRLAKAEPLRGFQYNFLFYTMDSNRSHMTLNAYVTDVLPSRLTELHDIQDSIRMLNLCNEEITKNVFREFKNPANIVDYLAGSGSGWPFIFLHQQYSRTIQTASGPKQITDNTYYRLIEAIFAGSELRIDVIKTFVVSVRNHYHALFDTNSKENYSGFQREVIKTLLLHRYLIDSRAIKGDTTMTINEVGGNPATPPLNGRTASGNYATLDDLFEDLGIGMADEERRASVAVGVLANKTLCVQRHERDIKDRDRGKEPFWSNLNDLNLDLQLLRKIAVRAIDKLADYQKIGLFTQIEQEATVHLSRIQGQPSLSKDELSYYFSVGLVMGDAVARCPLDENDKSRGWC